MRITNEDVKKALKNKIRKTRKSLGYTQEHVAESSGISTDLFRNIENGRNIGSMTTLLNICNILKISPNTLFSELLDFNEDTVDSTLGSYIDKLSKKDRELLKQIIIHMDKKY